MSEELNRADPARESAEHITDRPVDLPPPAGLAEPVPDLDAPWYPSDKLRRSLGAGAVAALVAAALGVVSGLLALGEGIRDEFTWSLGLSLAAILPQLVLADSFWNLGEETRSRSLKVGSMGTFLCLWALTAYGLALEEFVPGWASILLFIVAGLLALGPYAIISEQYPECHKYSTAGVVLLVGLYILLRFGLRAWLGQLGGLGMVVVIMIAIVLLFGLLVFPIWFGISLIRERRRLRVPALALGVAQLLVNLGGVVLLIVVIVDSLSWLAGQQAANEQAFLQQMEPWHRVMTITAMVGEMTLALLTVGLFLSVRARPGAADSTYAPPQGRA
jgi:hypothetical protein